MSRIEHITPAELSERAFHETDAFLEAIDGGAVYVVDGFRSREAILRFRALARDFAAAEPPSWHPCLDGVPDYHRVVDEYPGAWVKARMHAFYFHAFNGGRGLFEEFRDVFRIKCHLAGEPDGAYLDAVPSDGVIARVVSNQYPRGGGYLAEHRDPTSRFARVQTIVQASDPGEDFQAGGLYVRDEDGDEPVPIDPHSRMGDLLVLSPDVRHGVAHVDPEADLDWAREDGRWMILPILLRSDHGAGTDDKPQQVA
jgi:hypothetical protein